MIQRKSKQIGDDCGLISEDSHISANGNFELCIYPTVDANDYAWTLIFLNITADLRGSNASIPSSYDLSYNRIYNMQIDLIQYNKICWGIVVIFGDHSYIVR